MLYMALIKFYMALIKSSTVNTMWAQAPTCDDIIDCSLGLFSALEP